MGRYYSGDINGKFWFAVQSSDAPERFGAVPYEPNEIEYVVEESEPVLKELKKIKKSLGNRFKILDKFFKKATSYSDSYIIKLYEEAGIDPEFVKKDISEYADYQLGKKIATHLKDNSDCYFTAEL